jgi:hypothetical protein
VTLPSALDNLMCCSVLVSKAWWAAIYTSRGMEQKHSKVRGPLTWCHGLPVQKIRDECCSGYPFVICGYRFGMI